jgi:hypothetical protein
VAKTITDIERVTAAMREIESILSEHIEPGPRDPERTIDRIFVAMDRPGVQEAVERLSGKRAKLRLVE